MKARAIFLLLFLNSVVFSAPITVVINGNFGPPTGGTTVLDNQDYVITYTVPDPHTPTTAFGIPNTFVSAVYDVQAQLSIPGLNFSIINNLSAGYYNQLPLGLWLNLMTFTGLPVGDFMVLTPFQSLGGSPLWNGLADTLGDPELLPLVNAPSYARFFVEHNTLNQGPIPLAVYESGAAFISQTAPVPEPATLCLVAAGLLAAFSRRQALR